MVVGITRHGSGGGCGEWGFREEGPWVWKEPCPTCRSCRVWGQFRVEVQDRRWGGQQNVDLWVHSRRAGLSHWGRAGGGHSPRSCLKGTVGP